ncbi:MAG: signal peptidase I [archaeon]
MNKTVRDILEIAAYIVAGYLIAVGANAGLSYGLHTDYPVVAVVSTSMEHDNPEVTYYSWLRENNITEEQWSEWSFDRGMQMGELVVVRGIAFENVQVGDVIVYKAENREPIIHRVIARNEAELYTKGDNNMNTDQSGSGIAGPITEKEYQGKAIIHMPWLGFVKVTAMYVTGGL